MFLLPVLELDLAGCEGGKARQVPPAHSPSSCLGKHEAHTHPTKCCVSLIRDGDCSKGISQRLAFSQMPMQDIKWKTPECTSAGCQERRGQETRNDVQTIPPKIASEMLWNVESGSRRGGHGGKGQVCARRGVCGPGRGYGSKEEGTEQGGRQAHHPEPPTLPCGLCIRPWVPGAGPRQLG